MDGGKRVGWMGMGRFPLDYGLALGPGLGHGGEYVQQQGSLGAVRVCRSGKSGWRGKAEAGAPEERLVTVAGWILQDAVRSLKATGTERWRLLLAVGAACS